MTPTREDIERYRRNFVANGGISSAAVLELFVYIDSMRSCKQLEEDWRYQERVNGALRSLRAKVEELEKKR